MMTYCWGMEDPPFFFFLIRGMEDPTEMLHGQESEYNKDNKVSQ